MYLLERGIAVPNLLLVAPVVAYIEASEHEYAHSASDSNSVIVMLTFYDMP